MRWVKQTLLSFIFCQLDCFAQNNRTSTIWYFPGVSYQVSPTLALWGHFGKDSGDNISAIYLQSFIELNKHIVLNPAYLYLALDEANGVQKEHTFMNAVNIHLPIGRLILDNRNMLWNWIRKDAADLYFYRNRLRLRIPFDLGSKKASIYTFDEVTYSFHENRWSRNRLGLGFTFEVFVRLKIDAFYAAQQDASANGSNIFLIMATIQF